MVGLMLLLLFLAVVVVVVAVVEAAAEAGLCFLPSRFSPTSSSLSAPLSSGIFHLWLEATAVVDAETLLAESVLVVDVALQIIILLPVDCYCWQARIRVSCSIRALLLLVLLSSIVERASRGSSKALSQTSAPESAPSAKGLAHDRMIGGIKGKRKK
jgi:hypothetical protein